MMEKFWRGGHTFSGILEASGGKRAGAGRRVVSYRRSGRSQRDRKLANYWPGEKYNHPEFRPQGSAGTAGIGADPNLARGRTGRPDRQSAKFFGGAGGREFRQWDE